MAKTLEALKNDLEIQYEILAEAEFQGNNYMSDIAQRDIDLLQRDIELLEAKENNE